MRVNPLVIFYLWALGVAPPASWGACNVIPTQTGQLLGGPHPEAAAVSLVAAVLADQQQFSVTPYKGALGRIDRVLLSAERADPVRVALDGQCVGGTYGTPLAVTGTKDLVAAAVFSDEGRTSSALLTTGEGPSCDALAREKGQTPAIEACRDGGIGRLDARGPVLTVAFPAAPKGPGGRPARIAVFRATSAERAAAILERVATTHCNELCRDAAMAADLGACIDTLYAPVGLTAAQVVYAPDLVKCGLMEVPTPIPWNDFSKLCQDGPGATPPGCQGGADVLSMWEDACHGVYVPFDWKSIREVSATESVDRVVHGQSAVSRREKVEGGRAWVPGREYVGTLAETDIGPGGTFSTDPRKAAIEVWYPNGEEFGLEGVVDKDKSIVHVVPRLAASYVCDQRTASGASDEACMRVATQPALDSTRCACTDRYPADCTCTTLSQGRFFQCASTKMPCTRHAHCNPTDTCSARPHCQKKDDVWDPSRPLPAGGTECWNDQECATDAARPQCGFLLFDVGKKREPNNSLVKIDKTITATGPRKQRGACKATSGNLRKACNNQGNPPACTASEGDCIGYVLEALGKK